MVGHHRQGTRSHAPMAEHISSGRRAAIITATEEVEEDPLSAPFHSVPTMTMESDAEDAAAIPTKENNHSNGVTATRSKSIAIVKKRPESVVMDDNIMQTCSSMERMYDWATWRMYNRITDHRRRFPVRYSYSLTKTSGMRTPSYMDPRACSNHDNDGVGDDDGRDSDSSNREERFFDGEIFDLEI